MTVVTRWWWVRHAPVTVNNRAIYGQQDLPCDCSDAAAFRDLAKQLPDGGVCVTTPLQRTEQTARAALAQGFSCAENITEPDFREQDFGLWQGQTHEGLAKADPGSWRHYWLAPAYERPPEGESFADLTARVDPVITRLNEDHAGRDIIAFVHGGTIRAALALALDLSPARALAFVIGNCSITRLDYIADGTVPPC